MFHAVRGRAAVAAVGACAVLTGPVAFAQASNTDIASTFKASVSTLNKDEAGVARGLTSYRNRGVTGPAVRARRHEVSDIRTLNGKIKRDAASTSVGRRAKSDITTGLSDIAGAYGKLATALARSTLSRPVTSATVSASSKLDKRGRATLLKGLKLLG